MPDQSSASDGDGVYGPYRIAYSASGACDYNGWGQAGRAAAGLADADYDHVIHVLPINTTCGWGGLAYMPGRYSWVLTNSFDPLVANTITGASSADRFRGVTSHSFGRNLGIHHAGAGLHRRRRAADGDQHDVHDARVR